MNKKQPLESPKDLVFFDKTFDDFLASGCLGINNSIPIGRLSKIPTKSDLCKFSKIRLRKKRSRKNFDKYWYRYVSSEIYSEFMAKVFVAPILRPLNYNDIGKKLFFVEPLPENVTCPFTE